MAIAAMRVATVSTRATTTALPQSARVLSPQCWSCSSFNAQSRCGPEWALRLMFRAAQSPTSPQDRSRPLGSLHGPSGPPRANGREQLPTTGQPCSAPHDLCLGSPPVLLRPSSEKTFDVVQRYLVVVGFREDRTVLTQLTRSIGGALRSARKDNVQLRAH
jgi:hypothetical protein